MNAEFSNKVTPTISVILPVYNASLYLQAAVSSILNQSFSDFEFLIFDDGSTDKTLQMLKKFASEDTRVKIFSRENKGLIATLNELIDNSLGRYIARMDADDISLPDRFFKQVMFLDSNPEIVVVGSWIEMINDKSQQISEVRSPIEHEKIDQKNLAGHSSISHPSAMIRKSALLEVGRYDLRFKSAEDLDLWLKLAEVGKLANIPEVLLQYRIHSSAISEIERDGQGIQSQIACEEAAKRRGIESAFDPASTDWRAAEDINSQHKYAVKYGWMAWNQRKKSAWWTYAKKALVLKPFKIASWRLLVFGIFKSPNS